MTNKVMEEENTKLFAKPLMGQKEKWPMFIIAETYRQAYYWAKENALNREQWEYVAEPNQLRGIARDSQIVRVGEYYKRKDIGEIEHILRLRGIES